MRGRARGVPRSLGALRAVGRGQDDPYEPAGLSRHHLPEPVREPVLDLRHPGLPARTELHPQDRPHHGAAGLDLVSAHGLHAGSYDARVRIDRFVPRRPGQPAALAHGALPGATAAQRRDRLRGAPERESTDASELELVSERQRHAVLRTGAVDLPRLAARRASGLRPRAARGRVRPRVPRLPSPHRHPGGSADRRGHGPARHGSRDQDGGDAPAHAVAAGTPAIVSRRALRHDVPHRHDVRAGVPAGGVRAHRGEGHH